MGSNRCQCSRYAVVVLDDNGAETFVTTECRADPIGATSLFAPGHDAKLKSLFVEAWFNGPESLHELAPGDATDRWHRTRGNALDEARLFGWGLAVARAIDKRSARLRSEAARSAINTALAGSRPGESRATRAVFRALQKPDGQPNSHEPIGASFGSDRADYEVAAQAWLRDRSSLSGSTIEAACWDDIHSWFILGR